MSAWRKYRISVEFPVPLGFAYRWCTDYTADDAKYGGEDKTLHLQRRIIERSGRRVVFENLYDQGKGWGWERHVVTLRPPRHWHSVGRGNHHESVLDYSLTAISKNRTRFDMRWKSRPVGHGRGPRTPVDRVERYVTQLWNLRATFLVREYRLSLVRRRARPSSD